MSNYNIILFDLDGTLSDPKVGITKSVQYALEKFGISEPDLDKLEPFIGPPLEESFEKFYGFNEEQCKQGIAYYRERFKVKGLYENILFPEIPKLLEQLKAAGKVLVLATSKPTVFAEQILQYFSIDHYFDLVIGSNLDGTRVAKAEIISHILGELNSYDKQEFIMIGDRRHDIIGAHHTGIHSIGVLYGYGPLEEMQQASPTYIVEDVRGISGILL
ncbi:HAD family hydrolase [Paenibacillus sp. GCM10012307]|uniref:HAD family hydrolase n=1 Tax=Paenibacillus roseus TaxID=2798579 RepID=A0A934J207_9BACL|nr:HAD family hydrolase [Paenibacillus roseus]MBJ6360094.1 HAD family hydrolase [Paenibacillus roseus]